MDLFLRNHRGQAMVSFIFYFCVLQGSDLLINNEEQQRKVLLLEELQCNKSMQQEKQTEGSVTLHLHKYIVNPRRSFRSFRGSLFLEGVIRIGSHLFHYLLLEVFGIGIHISSFIVGGIWLRYIHFTSSC